MARQRKRRIRTAHPGVKLKRMRRETGETWVARFIDADTGREKQESLTALGITDESARRAWAIEKSNSLRSRAAALASGAALRTETPISQALKLYLDHRASEVALSTFKSYSDAGGDFAAWASTLGLVLTETISPAHLLDFRTAFLNRPKHVQASGKGIGRGARKEVKDKRAPVTLNKALRSLKTILNFWRARGITPHLNSDTISDSLKPVKGIKSLPVFLRARQCRELLEAALRHDAECFNLTRQENAGEGTRGTTPCYTPIAPYIVVALLGGFRFHELASLRWHDIDLEANEITLDACATKTKQARRINLTETPALAALLASLKLRVGGAPYVWGKEPYRRDLAESARKRLVNEYGAPEFTWHDLRRTCGTFLTCAPAIYGAASAFMSAKRLGHSVVVSEKHYAGSVSNIPATATTLEAALGITDCVEAVIGRNLGATQKTCTAMSAS